jgi:hypothetical protein
MGGGRLSSAKDLRDIYAHLHPEHQKSAADALSKRGSRPTKTVSLDCGMRRTGARRNNNYELLMALPPRCPLGGKLHVVGQR